MTHKLPTTFALALFCCSGSALAQKLAPDIPYVESGHGRQILDIHTPENASEGALPVMFWIHGGGWETGDKSDAGLKPKALTERGFVFVSTNYIPRIIQVSGSSGRGVDQP